MKTLNELHAELDANIPRSAVKQREGASKRTFSYLSTDYVIARMNALFGNLNWSTETVEIRLVHTGETTDKYGKVKVEMQHIDENGRVVRTSHMGTGYGDGSDSENLGRAHELAAKEAESDALKRACKNVGQSMGLALYDKDQTNVVEDKAPAGKTAPAPGIPTPIGTPVAQVKIQPSAPAATAQAILNAVSGASGSRPSAVGQHDSRPQGAPSGRDQLNKTILSYAKIVASKTQRTLDDIRADVRGKYGAEAKDLSDEQAAELVASLKQQAG
jgi:hypothetical protein